MGRLKAQENADRAEIMLAIRSFTVSVNCQTRGLTSIRKGQGKDHIPFLVNTDSITASENVSGGVQFKNRSSLRKAKNRRSLRKAKKKSLKSVEIIPPRQDVIRPFRLFLIDILLLQTFISIKIVTIIFVARL